MPAAVKLNQPEREALSEALYECFQIRPTDAYSCIQLANQIQLNSGVKISYNTLRRVFGIVKYQGNPSSFTMDLLAKVTGYPTWDDFVKALQNRDNERFLIKNHLLSLHGVYDLAWIRKFVQCKVTIDWQDSFQLKSLVQGALLNRDSTLLFELTNLLHYSDDDLSLQRLYMSFEPIVLNAIDSGPEFWSWVGDILLVMPTLRKVLLEFYVHEAALDGYYGYWLNLNYSEMTEEFLVFRMLLNGQNAFAKRLDVSEFREQIGQILFTKRWCQFHPIIKGRIAAWAAIFNLSNSKTHLDIFESCKTWYEKAAFTTFFYRLYWTFERDGKFLGWNWEGVVEKIGLLNTFEFSQWNNYLMIQAQMCHFDNDHVACGVNLDMVDPHLFALDNYEWFQEVYKDSKEYLQH